MIASGERRPQHPRPTASQDRVRDLPSSYAAHCFNQAFTLVDPDECKSGQCQQMKMPKLIPVSLGIFTFSLSVRPISLRLSPSPTERVVRKQSSCGRWQTLFVS